VWYNIIYKGDDNMIVYTYQSRAVLDKIMNDGVHIVSWSDFDKHSPYQHAKGCYQDLASHLGYNNSIVWGWINQEYTEKHGNDVLIVLDVPEQYVTLTSYYDWSDYIYFTEDEDQENRELAWSNVFNTDGVDEIQVVMPFIKKEWIKKIS
jgi:hypothetical protein